MVDWFTQQKIIHSIWINVRYNYTIIITVIYTRHNIYGDIEKTGAALKEELDNFILS